MPKLFVYPEKGEAFYLPLKKEKTSIERSADNAISTSDSFCSGCHAFIYPSELGYVVRDNNSKNGTFVNGKKIQSETELKKGDEILIGLTRITFDKELSKNVEVMEAATLSENVNTIIHLKEILKKHDIDTTLKADATPFDLEKIKSEHKAFSILSKVSQALISNRPIEELLDHVMDLICQNLPMDRGILMLREGNPAQLIPKVVRINNKKLKNQKIQVIKSIINMALNKNSAILTYDAQADSRFRM